MADSAHVNAYLNLATASLRLNNYEQAVRQYERASRFDSLALMRPPISTEYGGLLIILGRSDDADRHFRRVAGRTALYDRVLGYRGLGMSAIWQGRLEAAVAFFRQASESGRQAGTRLTIARNALLESLALLLAADTATAKRTLEAVLPGIDSAGFQPEFLALVGHGLLRLGEVAAADRLLAKVNASGDTTTVSDRRARAFLGAAIAAARRDTAAARVWFPAAAGFGQQNLTWAWEAMAAVARGDRRGAEAALDSVLANPTATAEGTFEQFNAWWLKARIAEQAGDPARAREAYRALAKQWESGDASGVLLRIARAKLSAAPP